MAQLEMKCPDCEEVNRFPESKQGKTVHCKVCSNPFKLTREAKLIDGGESDEEDEKLDDRPAAKKKSKGSIHDDEFEEGDDEDRPRKRRNRRREPDDRPRRGESGGPRRSSGSGGGGKAILIIVGVIFGFCVLSGVIGVFFSGRKTNSLPPTIEQNKQLSQLDQNLENLKKNPNDHGAIRNIAGMPVDQNRRDEVAAALEGALNSQDHWAIKEAAKALAKWHRPASIPKLHEKLNHPDEGIRIDTMNALGDIKDTTSLPFITAKLIGVGRESQTARVVLEKYGPAAEDAVLQALGEGGSAQKKTECCRILEKIGTSKSVPKLTEVSENTKKSKDRFELTLSTAARLALTACQNRK